MSLFPMQNLALYEGLTAGGLFAMMGVGEGKSLLSFLLPRGWRSKRPLLTMPAKNIEGARGEYAKFNPHFNLAALALQSLEKISRNPSLLWQLRPDCIIVDEADNCKWSLVNGPSNRTRRLDDYIKWARKNVEGFKVAVMTGTMFSTSVADCWHLARWALDKGSPLPVKKFDIRAWANLLDTGKDPQPEDVTRFAPVYAREARVAGEKLSFHEAAKRHIRRTPGVVITDAPKMSVKLDLRILQEIRMPPEVEEACDKLKATWETETGEEIMTAMDLAEKISQQASGYTYFWDWPNDDPDYEFLEASKEWSREAEAAKRRSELKPVDSPGEVKRLVEAFLEGRVGKSVAAKGGVTVDTLRAYKNMLPHSGKKLPPKAAHWVSLYFVEVISRLAKKLIDQGEPPLVWYKNHAMAAALIRRFKQLGIPFEFCGAGKAFSEQLETLARSSEPPKTLILSAHSHYRGKNLQKWGANIITFPLSSSRMGEQLIGRTQRNGQKRKSVLVLILVPHPVFLKAFLDMLEGAMFSESMGEPQRLCRTSIPKEILSQRETLATELFGDSSVTLDPDRQVKAK